VEKDGRVRVVEGPQPMRFDERGALA